MSSNSFARRCDQFCDRDSTIFLNPKIVNCDQLVTKTLKLPGHRFVTVISGQ
jgi:hypothetical protein